MGFSGFQRDASGFFFGNWQSRVLGSREKWRIFVTGKRERERDENDGENEVLIPSNIFNTRLAPKKNTHKLSGNNPANEQYLGTF